MSDAAAYVGLVLLATTTKLFSSIDDIVWLTPFVSGKMSKQRKVYHTCLYQLLNCLIIGCSIALAAGGIAALSIILGEDPGYWDAERVIGFLSAGVLGLFAIKVAYDERQAAKKIDKKKEGTDDFSAVAIQLTDDSEGYRSFVEHMEDSESEEGGKQDNENERPYASKRGAKSAKKYSTWNLVCIALLGSLDELIIQSNMLLNGTYNYTQYVVGSLLGALVVNLICLYLGHLKIIVEWIEKVPLSVIIALLAVLALVNALWELM